MADFDWLSVPEPAFAAQESWDNGTYDEPSLLHLYYEPAGPFTIACGAGLLAEHIRRFRFSPEVIQRMGRLSDHQGRSVLHESYLNFLQRLRLRVQVNAAPEGTLLLPGEPLLVVYGPKAQIQLMESAIRLLVWEPTHWATQAALDRWNRGDWEEEDTPALPAYGFNVSGWKTRALFIGGGTPEAELDKLPAENDIFRKIEHAPGEPMVQIRRLFKGNQPLADLWLTRAQEEVASVSKSTAQFQDEISETVQQVKFSRFQNIYQPVLVKGHPVLAASRLGYLRQRTLKQLEAFHTAGLAEYVHGWFC